MKRLIFVFLILLLQLVGCMNSNYGPNIDMLNLDISYLSYGKPVLLISDYEEFKTQISNHEELKNIDEEFFVSHDLLCILVSSNAEEYNNKIQFKSVELINDEWNFTFSSRIEDDATDLAFFLTSFNFKVSKSLDIKEENIKIIKNRIIEKESD